MYNSYHCKILSFTQGHFVAYFCVKFSGLEMCKGEITQAGTIANWPKIGQLGSKFSENDKYQLWLHRRLFGEGAMSTGFFKSLDVTFHKRCIHHSQVKEAI